MRFILVAMNTVSNTEIDRFESPVGALATYQKLLKEMWEPRFYKNISVRHYPGSNVVNAVIFNKNACVVINKQVTLNIVKEYGPRNLAARADFASFVNSISSIKQFTPAPKATAPKKRMPKAAKSKSTKTATKKK